MANEQDDKYYNDYEGLSFAPPENADDVPAECPSAAPHFDVPEGELGVAESEWLDPAHPVHKRGAIRNAPPDPDIEVVEAEIVEFEPPAPDIKEEVWFLVHHLPSGRSVTATCTSLAEARYLVAQTADMMTFLGCKFGPLQDGIVAPEVPYRDLVEKDFIYLWLRGTRPAS